LLKRLDIVSIRVRDWKAAVEWYRDKLGLKPLGLHDHPWCMMALPEGDTVLALDGTNPVLGASNCIPSIQCEDLPSTLVLLKERGVEFTRELEEDEGYRMATLRDCEGNLINVYEYFSGKTPVSP
jgi:catechol 2,3-dioxygenase-like lactoylglutathione lyase family enzyme